MYPAPARLSATVLAERIHLFCLLPDRPVSRSLELAPANWKKTLENEDAQQRLAANVFRRAVLELDHPPDK